MIALGLGYDIVYRLACSTGGKAPVQMKEEASDGGGGGVFFFKGGGEEGRTHILDPKGEGRSPRELPDALP